MFQRILVVCTGNVCRSPVVEAMIKRRLPGKQVSSAGLGALVGHPVDPHARRLAEAEGLDVSEHKARQISPEMIHESDLVLVMSEGQRRAVGNLAPESLGKAMLLGCWLEGGQGREIPDPYRKSPEVFERVHQLLSDATQRWCEKLDEPRK